MLCIATGHIIWQGVNRHIPVGGSYPWRGSPRFPATRWCDKGILQHSNPDAHLSAHSARYPQISVSPKGKGFICSLSYAYQYT